MEYADLGKADVVLRGNSPNLKDTYENELYFPDCL